MDAKDLKSLIKMIMETDITEFEMENTEEKVVIKRGSRTEVIQMAAPAVGYAAPAALPAAPVAAPASAPVAAAAAKEEISGETITSPIVGTFYRAASPEAPAFCEEGQVVEKGQVICLVEAMKMFNEIEADFKWKIVKICVDNAQPVEFGQPLCVIEKL